MTNTIYKAAIHAFLFFRMRDSAFYERFKQEFRHFSFKVICFVCYLQRVSSACSQ